MKYIYDETTWTCELVFETSGRRIPIKGYPSQDCPIGIGPSAMQVYEGSDKEWRPAAPLTATERLELATYMIERWTRFALADRSEEEG